MLAVVQTQFDNDLSMDEDTVADDFEDNITITIDASANTIMPAAAAAAAASSQLSLRRSKQVPPLTQSNELSRITSVMNASGMYTCDINMDLEMQAELNALICESIAPKTSKCIAVSFNKRIILIPITHPLSSRLQSIFWPLPRQYAETTLHMFNSLNIVSEIARNLGVADIKSLCGDNLGFNITDTIAIFSARYYYKATLPSRDGQYPSAGNTGSNCSVPATNNAGFYYYADFAIFIVQNMKIIEYAIHGYVSNINELLLKYAPKRIFYNSRPNKALDLFLRYPYQPFFAGITDQSKLTPITINRLHGTFNTLVFCDRQDTFCAFCNGLRDIRGLIFRLLTHQNMDMLAPTSAFTMTRRQLLQMKSTTTSNEKAIASAAAPIEPKVPGRRLRSVVVRPPPQPLSDQHRNNIGSRVQHTIRRRRRSAMYPYHQQTQRRHLKHAPKKSRRTF